MFNLKLNGQKLGFNSPLRYQQGMVWKKKMEWYDNFVMEYLKDARNGTEDFGYMVLPY